MRKSEEIKNLAKALAKFRQNIKQPLKDADNPFFKSKYVPLENVVEVIDEVGAPLGISFIQEAVSNEQGMVGVATTIFHESGEWIEFDPLYLKPEKNNAQGYGSSVTYARRYSLSSAFGITSDMDDDGNEASGNGKASKAKPKQPQTEPVSELLTQALGNAYNRIHEVEKGLTKNAFVGGLNQRLGKDWQQAQISEINEVGIAWLNELKAKNG